MFWSRSPSTSDEASTCSSSTSFEDSTPASPSSASSAAASISSKTDWTTNGPTGLGVISSLSEECTPLKHRYDSCFDQWFTDYLSIGDAQVLEQQRQRGGDTSPASDPASSSSKSKSSWLGSSSHGSTESSASQSATSSGNNDLERKKKAIMERYDRDCGALFKDYRECVKRAVTTKGLDTLIKEAREENPFPFDHQRAGDDRENNPPFPFPAARRE